MRIIKGNISDQTNIQFLQIIDMNIKNLDITNKIN